MKEDKLFMMIFRFTPDFNYQPTREEKGEMQAQWGNFIGNIAITEKLVSTYQLGFQGKEVKANSAVKEGIVISETQTLGGNMVVKANSIEEAATMAKQCPILQMGGSVEVRTILPM